MKNLPLVLITAASAQVLCQIFKFFLYSIQKKRLSFNYLTSPGGFPSAHSAFVTALSVAVGLNNGFQSDIFAVCCVFAAIVIYDAYRLRGAVEKHAKLFNHLTIQHFPEEHKNLSEMVGHSIPEIISGILAGGFFSYITMSFFTHF